MKEEITRCDNPDCGGGSDHFNQCGNGHDICGCCSFQIDAETNEFYCPLCVDLQGGRMK